jgi:hypothetical protein
MTDEPFDHEAVEALLGAYALDAVEPDERERIEEHLLTCPRCRAEVADHREVAALLAHGGAPAPEGIWDRIRDALEEPPPRLRLAIGPKDAADPASSGDGGAAAAITRRPAVVRAVAVAVALVAAAVIAVLGVQVAHLSDRLDRMRDDATVAAAATSALSDPTTRQATLRTESGEAEARVVLTGSGQGYLLADGLPALDGQVYQLWGTAGDAIVSLGVMGPRPGVVAFTASGDIGQILITAEDAPVAQTKNTPVVSGPLV